jgi:hypothetical protein
MAATVMAAMSGVSRRMLEASEVPETRDAMRDGLQVMVQAYVTACVVSSVTNSARVAASGR